MFKNCCKMNPDSQNDEGYTVFDGSLFIKVKNLGAGGYGTVALYNYKPRADAQEKEFEQRAIKTLLEYTAEKFNKEVLPLLRLKHKNIVHLYGETEIDSIRGIVFEYLAGGDLYDVIHHQTPYRYSLRDVLNWNIQSARALEYMHSFNGEQGSYPRYIHRDIKPQNMLLDSTCQILKIADFGLSKEMNSTNNTKGRGTLFYIAPEVLTSRTYDETCDVYSWTLTFWECLTGLQPFKECLFMHELEDKKLKENYLAYVSTASKRLNRLIQSGSSLDPKNRITMKSWRRILEILMKNCNLLEKQKQTKIIAEEQKKNENFRDPFVWILNERLTGEFFYGKGLETYKWESFSPKSVEKFLDELEKQQKEQN